MLRAPFGLEPPTTANPTAKALQGSAVEIVENPLRVESSVNTTKCVRRERKRRSNGMLLQVEIFLFFNYVFFTSTHFPSITRVLKEIVRPLKLPFKKNIMETT